MNVFSRLCIALVAAAALVLSGSRSAEKLTVWWVKGFYKSEDDALYEAIKVRGQDRYQGRAVAVRYRTAFRKSSPRWTQNPPDVAYIDVFDFRSPRKWAYEGKLEDISDVITPIKGGSSPTRSRPPCSTTTRRRKGVLRISAETADLCIEYWKDMLAEAGYKRVRHRRRGRNTGRSGATRCSPITGRRPASADLRPLPDGCRLSDSYYSFLTFMDAYNVKLVDDNGKLWSTIPGQGENG
jgi:multiple sugar transport system substrate-binding protein